MEKFKDSNKGQTMKKEKRFIVSLIAAILMAGLILPLSTAWAHLDRDEGNVAFIEYNGANYDDQLPGGEENYAPREWVAKKFYDTHGDFYDFLCIFTDFDYQMLKGESAFYLPVKNALISYVKG